MSFGLSAAGLKIMRLEDVLSARRQRYKDKFGDNFDLTDSTPQGQIIAIESEREAKIWELVQEVYNSQYRHTARGAALDNVLAITGNSRRGKSYSKVQGVARGQELTPVPVGTIISVQGNPQARFITTSLGVINIPDGETFKSGPIEMQSIEAGPIQALAGTLNVIETQVTGMESFTNELDASTGSDIEKDDEAKLRVDGELQIAGSATVEAIKSELKSRPNVEAVIVFYNKTMITDSEGRPPKVLDIIILGDDEDELAEAIYKVIGAGIETIGDIEKTVIDSDGFEHLIKFSRPDEINIYVEVDLMVDVNLFPVDGEDQVKNLILAYGSNQTVGQRVTVFGTKGLGSSFDSVLGINDFTLRVGREENPTTDDNIMLAAREIAKFDSSRIKVNII